MNRGRSTARLHSIEPSAAGREQTLATLRSSIAAMGAAPRVEALEGASRSALMALLEQMDEPGGVVHVRSSPGDGGLGIVYRMAARAARGGLVGWVHVDGFHPPSAADAGIPLERLISVDPGDAESMMRAVELLISSAAFTAIVVDIPRGWAPPARWSERSRRLVARARAARTTLVWMADCGEGLLRAPVDARLDLARIPAEQGLPDAEMRARLELRLGRGGRVRADRLPPREPAQGAELYRIGALRLALRTRGRRILGRRRRVGGRG